MLILAKTPLSEILLEEVIHSGETIKRRLRHNLELTYKIWQSDKSAIKNDFFFRTKKFQGVQPQGTVEPNLGFIGIYLDIEVNTLLHYRLAD